MEGCWPVGKCGSGCSSLSEVSALSVIELFVEFLSKKYDIHGTVGLRELSAFRFIFYLPGCAISRVTAGDVSPLNGLRYSIKNVVITTSTRTANIHMKEYFPVSTVLQLDLSKL
jgi:hypothetical protein